MFQVVIQTQLRIIFPIPKHRDKEETKSGSTDFYSSEEVFWNWTKKSLRVFEQGVRINL